MYGAIIGDVAGSFYEVLEIRSKNEKRIRSYMERVIIMDKKVPLFDEYSCCTDDSVLTCAIADAIMSNESYEKKLKEYGTKEIDLGKDLYGRSRFGNCFCDWVNGNFEGNSYGNGSAMRIGPIGFLFDSLSDVKNETVKATIPTHNHPDSLKAAEAITTSIFLLRKGLNKEQLKKYIEDNFYSLDYDIDNLRVNYIFTSKASDSVPQAIFCFLESNDFEDAIRKAISIGGDTDTIAAITGSLAEAYYGVPEELIEQVKPYLRDYMIPLLDKFYEKQKQHILKVNI